MVWTDSHCHVGYDGVGLAAVERAVAAGVTRVVTIGTDVERTRSAIEVTRVGRRAGLQLWATAGVHPHDAVAHSCSPARRPARVTPMAARDRSTSVPIVTTLVTPAAAARSTASSPTPS